MLITSCCTRFHAPSSICISVVSRSHSHTNSYCCFGHDVSLPLRHCPYKVFPFFSQNCSLAKNQMEQPVIAHPRALTDKITLIRDAGPSKFQVFPTPISESMSKFCSQRLKLCVVLFVKVIADFDATLTRYRVSGLRGQSMFIHI